MKRAVSRAVRFFLGPVFLCLGYMMGLHRKKDIFIISERWNEARDNGYFLFKYLRRAYPERPIYYIFDTSQKNIDYQKLVPLGNIIKFASLKMGIYLRFANYVASPHADIMNACCNWLGQGVWQKKTACFLQHGIIINSLGNYYINEIARFDIIISGSPLEYKFLQGESRGLGITPLYTGLARWDRLHGARAERAILVMPTWRRNLILPVDGADKNLAKRIARLKTTPYYIRWQAFLNSPRLHSLLRHHGVEMLFFAHPNLYRHLGEAVFTAEAGCVRIADPERDDLSAIVERSAMLVTDFSSIFWDFGYMKRPIIYYQFDEEEFRANHWQEGYFSYKQDGFGPVLEKQEEVIRKIEDYLYGDFEAEPEYLRRAETHFILRDAFNCERNYKAILNFEEYIPEGGADEYH